MPRIVRFLLSLALAAALARSAHADWPHLRGPNHDGVSAEIGLADAWPIDGPPRLWSRELGQGYSGFILADGKLYTQRQSLGGQYLVCLDPNTGDTIWEHRYDWAWQPKGAYPGPYSSPTAYGGKIYYTSTSGIVGCVDAATGAPLWSLNVREKFQGQGFGFGYAATPLVEDGKVIVPVGGPNASLVALDVSDGRTAWSVGSDPASYCAAFPLTFQGRRCVIGYLQNSMLLADLKTGKLLHRQPLSAGYDEHSAWPIYREPHLLLASPFKVPAVRYELTPGPDDSLNCKPQWTSKEMCNDVVSSVLFEGHLYGFDLKQWQASAHRTSRGNFRCLDWATGKTCWSTDQVGHASVLVADGKLILLNDTGTLILARAEPTAYHELARTQSFEDEICWTPPLHWQGKLYVRSPSKVVCLHVGRLDGRLQTPTTSPAVRGIRFDPGWLLSRERDFPNDAPSWGEMTLWFTACLGIFAAGALIAAAIMFRRRLPGTPIWLGLVFILGALGPNALSALADQCVFTWPASLYAAFHGTLLACCWAEQRSTGRWPRWFARLSVLGFLLVGYGYFQACKLVGMYIAWSFLVGFPLAFPFTFLAVRADLKSHRLWIVAAWTLLAFTAFFWSCQALFLWKTSQTA